ncbi:unnamed protein product [Mytilus coruscus]|uniref:BTB domain-containing protein n=1 Tax=Mytilus coruscus TaxID=42192 RepID=A0A6J8C9W2_MYTCO|nr:unnamed protein product [Mytilus coruscus]
MAVKDRIGKLFLQNKFSDVIFVFPENDYLELHGHIVIIATASSFLESLLKGPFENNELRVEITNCSPSIFKLLLRFIYLDNIHWKEESLVSRMDIFQCAEQYGVVQLADQCKREIQDCLQRPFNYIEIFRYSKQLQLEYVYNTTLSIIATEFETVVKEKNFMSLTAEELKLFLQKSDSILIGELTLFKTLDKWASVQCKLKDKITSGEEKRQELGQLLFQVRIPLIPLQTFSDEIVGTGILTNHEQLTLFKYYSGVEKSTTSVCGFSIKPRQKKTEQGQWISKKRRSYIANW